MTSARTEASQDVIQEANYSTDESKIQDFFKGTRVFITGGTGFMGQILLEKLLRTCSGIERVYLLLRPKKGKDIETRLNELLDGPVFERVQKEQPGVRSKVTLVMGDVGSEELGMSLEDREMLVKEVHVVFHVAATVKFDEKLRLAVAINVRGTRCIVGLARQMKKLKALVHVSTAYANCPVADIEEKFYPPGMEGEKLQKLCDSLTDEQIEQILPSILGQWPNTYAFTKATGEDSIREGCRGLPVAILRPSIVINTASEPVPGWINNIYGAIGVTVGAATGLLRTLYCDKNIVADIVPVDLAINCCIAAAWDVATQKPPAHSPLTPSQEDEAVPIYNYISSTRNPITWGEYMRYAECGLDFPLMQSIWCYCFTLNKHRSLNWCYEIFLHFLPALLVDAGALLLGQKPRLWAAYKKVHRFTDVIAYFSTQQWHFRDENVERLWRSLGARDKELFAFDIEAIKWDVMIDNALRGVRQFVFKESMDNVPEAKRRYRKLVIAHTVLKSLFTLLFAYLLYCVVRCFI